MSGEGSGSAGNNAVFSPAQMQALGAMLDQAFERRDRREGASNNPQESSGGNGGQIVPAPQAETLRAEHIGYFDPGFDDEKDPGSSVVNSGRHIFYRDVFVFVNRLKDVAAQRTNAVVAGLVQSCLRGEALVWQTSELSETELTILRTASLEQWCTILTNRFKERSAVALRKLQAERYTFADARSGRRPRAYVQNILRYAKAADMTTFNQLTTAWNNLAFEFRRDIPEPTASTSVSSFMNQLDSKAGIWEEVAQRATKINQRKDDYEGRNFKPSSSRYQNNANTYTTRQFNQTRALPSTERRLIGGTGSGSRSAGKNQSSSHRPERNVGRPDGKKTQRSKGKAYAVEDFPEDKDPDNDAEESQDQDREDQGDYYADEDLDYYEPHPDDDIEDYFGSAIATQGVRCHHCQQEFASKNQLHSHLGNPGKGRQKGRSSCAGVTAPDKSEGSQGDSIPAVYAVEESIIESAAKTEDVGTGHAFRNYHYAMAMAKLAKKCVLENICLDTGCSVSLADRAWIKECLPDVEIRKMASPITVRGLGSSRHQTDEYVILSIYLPGKTKDGQEVTAKTAPREIHLVDELKAKMLVGMDIMKPEGIDILSSRSVASISSCKVHVPIELKPKGRAVRQPVHARQSVVVPPHTQMLIPVHFTGPLPDSRDFLFEPDDESLLSLYAHLVDSSMSAVLAKNDSDLAIQVPRNRRMGTVAEADFDSCYHVTPSEEMADLATRRPRKDHQSSWLKKVFNKVVATSAIALLAVAGPTGSAGTTQTSGVANIPSISKDIPGIPGIANLSGPIPEATKVPAPDLTVNHTLDDLVLPSGVTIHAGSPQIAAVANEFPKIWEEGGFADVPQQDWMRIPLRSDWESKVPKTARIYPLSNESKAIVDKTFDKLHDQGRMVWTNTSTPFSYPVFVVWKAQPSGERKGRVVVDIRGLNAITQPDVYPLPLQADLIGCVKDCLYISVIDCASFFYQWRVHPDDRHKLTVITHRGQESFNVAVMGYKNSPAYVQRQIDRLLRALRKFARAYVDDVVVFSKTLEEHVDHLRQVFALFSKYGISINPAKAFLGYPSVQLLGQKVDSLGLYTAEDKLRAISKLRFPSTLSQLEIYLGLTGWLRNYVPHYAALTKPLQDRKTMLLLPAPKSGNERKNFATKTLVGPPSRAEEESFRALQQALSKPTFLTHFDAEMTLYIDLDASKRFGFGAMAYHVANSKTTPKTAPEISRDLFPSRTDVRPILFLSRLLKDAETRYWPTELEIAGIVWVLSKLRHMVESAPKTVIYTDHGAALGIAKQTSLTTSSTDKLNLRLVRASDYIQRFRNIEFRHKPGKQHVVPDALSRLDAAMGDAEYAQKSGEGVLDALQGFAYTTTALVEISPELRQELIEGYAKDPAWDKTLKVLEENEKLGENAATLSFERDNGLIFHLDDATGDHAFTHRRLCVPDNAVKQFFEIAHSSDHIGFAKMFEVLSKQWYIHGLARQLRNYLRHCPQCQLYQTRRHLPHGSLQPIITPPMPFHTLTIDFILALPKSRKGYDCMLSVTDKYPRRITLIPGKSTFTAAEWATRLLRRLRKIDWGLPKVIISDRDRKFLKELWTALFEQLGVKLLYSTAYHPQTDGSSERTNQTVEIALRFWMSTLNNPEEWPVTIPAIQSTYNNSISATTKHTPNEVAYGFSLNKPLDLASTEYEKQTLPPHLVRLAASDAIAFAQMNSKFHYDRRHQPQFFRQGDQVLLRLHHGYKIPANHGKKYSQQYAGPFQVLERIGRLAYRLDIPEHWRLHPVFTVAQLEPCPPEQDPYRRPRPTNPPGIDADQREDPKIPEWHVERLLNKRVVAKGKGFATEYLVRWKNWGPQWDKWTNANKLFCPDLIEEYEKHANPGAREKSAPETPIVATPSSSRMLAVVIPPKGNSQETSRALVPTSRTLVRRPRRPT